MHNYVIIANGPFPNNDLIQDAIHDKRIVALDGAANKLTSLHILPHVILGDFDSVNKKTQQYWGITQTFDELTNDSKPYLGKHDVLIVPAKMQNDTDLVKAIRYCDRQGAQSITIICATGGREDHHEGTKMALKTEYRANRLIIVHTEQQSLRYAQDESIELIGDVGDYCGVIATNTGRCTSEGLRYECNQHEFSICNQLKASSATLRIEGQALIIMPPQLASQRKFLENNPEGQSGL
ncbi:MAG: thiamine diphosphokinase [Legionellaceae bacterium]|nr:thiamine diphosphokinase [Legionellaceae bacterium]